MSQTLSSSKHVRNDDNTIPPGLAAFVHLIPKNEVCIAALKMAHQQLSTPIFNHSLRVFLYAQWLSENDPNARLDKKESWGLEFPTPDLIFLACILHDVGTAEEHNGELRFEVEGGNAAVGLMRKYGYSDQDAREVWLAISCHTSPHIVENIGPLSRVVRHAVLADFSHIKYGKDHAQATEFEKNLPRLDIEEILAREIVGQILKCRSKAPHVSWPNALLQGHEVDPNYKGVNPEF